MIYRSTACYEMDAAQLSKILVRSRVHNHRRRITGVLLYAHEEFMQLLEGREDEVKRLYACIVLAPRHTNLAVLLAGPQPRRIFPDWTMGYAQVEATDFTWLNGYIDPQRRADIIPPTYNAGQVIMELLAEFMEGRGAGF